MQVEDDVVNAAFAVVLTRYKAGDYQEVKGLNHLEALLRNIMSKLGGNDRRKAARRSVGDRKLRLAAKEMDLPS